MAKIMGTCGVAPRAAAALPTSICADKPGEGLNVKGRGGGGRSWEAAL
jgi:hypothetical protein